MRVLFLNQTAQVSGAERSLLALLRGLEGRVERVVACPEGELADEVRALGVAWEPLRGTQASFRMHPLHTARGLLDIGRSALAVRRLERRLAPDLVHANTTRAALLAIGPGRRAPLLAHIRDWVPDGRFPRLVLSVVGRNCDAVLANSSYIARKFDTVPMRRPAAVIHNPVDLGRFDPDSVDGAAVRAELGLAADASVLTVVAQITPWKGQDDAIRAAAGVLASGREVDLLLVGSAKFSAAGAQYDNVAFERSLHALAEELGIAARVHFLGERDDVPQLLAASDLLLLSSWREAFGRIAVEAMAMAVPVVASSEGGPAEIIDSGLDGLLVEPRRPDLWATEIAGLLQARERRLRMGVAARRRAAAFDLDVHAAAVFSLYEELLGSGASGASPGPR